MASPNLDLVRSIYADWERGDFSSTEWADPNIEAVWADGPSPSTHIGLAGMADGMREVVSAWEAWSVQAEQYRELDRNRVIVLYRASARGKASGVDLGLMQARGVTLFHVCDGKVTHVVIYWNRDRALADLGLAS